MKKPALITAEPLIDGLAARIARRDLPPPLPTIDPYAPAQVRERLLAAVALVGASWQHPEPPQPGQ